MRNNDREFPVFSLLYNVLAIPYNFFIGFVVGLAAPVAVIAAMVAGVRFLTGRTPFLRLSEDPEADERRLSLELVPSEEVQELFAVEKEKVMDDLGGLREQIKTMIEEARAKEGAAEAEGEA
ncbi:MAG: hypothetical protein P8189_25550 [Anaerolineae bacterium]|jgi:hypothetical protein